jgi:hypothetical protein
MTAGPTLAMRTWLALALVLALVMPVLTAVAYAVLTVAWQALIDTTPPDSLRTVQAAAALVTADRSRWDDPAWQHTLQARLASWDMGVHSSLTVPDGSSTRSRARCLAARGLPLSPSCSCRVRIAPARQGSTRCGSRVFPYPS